MYRSGSNDFQKGLSDFHKLAATVLKWYFPKQKPKVIIYKDYNNFQNDKVRAELDSEILKCDWNNMEYQHFLNLFTEVLSKHALLMKKERIKEDSCQKTCIRQ